MKHEFDIALETARERDKASPFSHANEKGHDAWSQTLASDRVVDGREKNHRRKLTSELIATTCVAGSSVRIESVMSPPGAGGGVGAAAVVAEDIGDSRNGKRQGEAGKKRVSEKRRQGDFFAVALVALSASERKRARERERTGFCLDV